MVMMAERQLVTNAEGLCVIDILFNIREYAIIFFVFAIELH